MEKIIIPQHIDGIPVFEYIPNIEDGDGIFTVSFVGEPANNKQFIALSGVSLDSLKINNIRLHLSEEKREVTGVVLRANYPIIRVNEQTGQPYYFFITPDQIKNAVEDFMRNKRTDSVNVNHSGDAVENVYLTSTFYMTPEYKQNHSEFNDVETGSWMATYKVLNDDVWNNIKSGSLHGYSPEIIGSMIPHKEETKLSNIDINLIRLMQVLKNGKKA